MNCQLTTQWLSNFWWFKTFWNKIMSDQLSNCQKMFFQQPTSYQQILILFDIICPQLKVFDVVNIGWKEGKNIISFHFILYIFFNEFLMNYLRNKVKPLIFYFSLSYFVNPYDFNDCIGFLEFIIIKD